MRLKNIIPVEYKLYIKYLFSRTDEHYFNVDNKKRKIVVALAADYGNLGDVAITIAQEEFLKEIFPDCEVIDFPIAKTYTHLKSLKSIISSEDLITIVGGGNMGDLYPDIELCRQFIIKHFPNNKVVSFPQTIMFEDNQSLKKCIKRYSRHKRLIIVAREKYSYEIMKEYFKSNKVILTPDIVLTLRKDESVTQRRGVTMLLRADKENCFSQAGKNKLLSALKQKFTVKELDTVIDLNNRMSIEERYHQLEVLLTKIQESEVVVTNRLHGMIFCAITKTPCVVLPIIGNKIVGVYEWIKDLGYIKYCTEYDIESIESNINKLMVAQKNQLDMKEKFIPLVDVLQKI